MRDSTKIAIDMYAERRMPPGSFVEAVLCNNLKEALGRADDDNLRDIYEIVKYCYWEIPANCWGSPQKVKAWLAKEMEV